MQLGLTQAKLYIKKTMILDKNVHKVAQGLKLCMQVFIIYDESHSKQCQIRIMFSSGSF